MEKTTFNFTNAEEAAATKIALEGHNFNVHVIHDSDQRGVKYISLSVDAIDMQRFDLKGEVARVDRTVAQFKGEVEQFNKYLKGSSPSAKTI